MRLLRALIRLVEMVWMVVLALGCLALALYCFNGLVNIGAANPVRLLHLATVRHAVGHFITQVTSPGVTAGLAVLGGLGAMLLGLIILVGMLWPARQRLAILEHASAGQLAARPRVLRQMVRRLGEQVDGVTIVRPRLSVSRRGRRGSLRVRGSRTRSSDPQAVSRDLTEAVRPVSEPFSLRPKVRVRVAEGRGRAQ